MKLIYSLLFLTSIFIQCQYYVGIDKNYHFNDAPFLAAPPSISSNGYIFLPQTYGVTKILPNGSIDLSFGINGKLPTTAYAPTVFVKNQSIYIGNGNQIIKYNYSGEKDTTFGNNGILTVTGTTVSGIIDINQNDNTMLIKYYQYIVKTLPSGSVDSNFAMIESNDYYVTDSNHLFYLVYENGYVIKKYDLQSGTKSEIKFPNSATSYLKWTVNKKNDDVYMSFGNQPTSITKYNANGIIDMSFGTNGIANFTLPFFTNGITIDTDSKILIYSGSATYTNSYSSLARLNEDGSVDNTFNDGSYIMNQKDTGNISYIKILDGNNKFLCINTFNYGSGSTSTSNFQFLRTQNPDELAPNLSVTNINNKNKILITPNPVKDIFEVKLSLDEQLKSINLFDANGKLITLSLYPKNNIRHLSKGVYYLEVRTDKGNYRVKLIKD